MCAIAAGAAVDIAHFNPPLFVDRDVKKIEQVRNLLTDVLNDVLKDYVADNDKLLVELATVLNKMKVRSGVPSPVVIP